MEPLTLYVLKVNGVFTLLFLFYLALLKRDTFYTYKRFFLLGIVVCSLFLPLFHVASLIPQRETLQSFIILIDSSLYEPQLITATQLGWQFWAGIVLAGGIAVSLIILIMKYIHLFWIIRGSSLAVVYRHKVYVPANDVNPFSFGGKVFVNPALYHDEELIRIIEHEQVHIRQLHQVDLLIVSVFQAFAWMNPLYYLFKTAVVENVEFLADRRVLKLGNDPKTYQYALLKVAQIMPVPLTQHFSISHLKKRIMMMNRKKTSRVWSSKYVLTVPVLLMAVLLINAAELKSAWANASFSPTEQSVQQEPVTQAITLSNDSTKAKPVVFVDGKKMPLDEMNAINPDSIASIDVLKGKSAITKYGNEGKNGVILITTKTKQASETVQVSGIVTDKNGQPLPGVAIAVKSDTKGTVTDLNGKYSLKYVPKNAVLRFSYINTPAQEIAVEKNNQVINVVMDTKTSLTGKIADITYSMKDTSNIVDAHPLYILNGVEINREDFSKIDPHAIQRIDVLKDKSAVSIYGDKGKNGVVLIKTKVNPPLNGAPIFDNVEVMPVFPGDVNQYLAANVKYPVEAQKQGIQGRVICLFIVNEDGSISDINVIKKVDPLLDAEAVRVIQHMPKWNPGKQRGQTVKVKYMLPVNFRLAPSSPVK